MELNGAVAIITGGARGLGRAVAEAYAARGACVAIVDILEDDLQRTADKIESAGGSVLPISADISDAFDVDAMAAKVEGQIGPVDILINCAGRVSAIGPVWEVDHEKWFRDVTVNLYGTFLCCRRVVKGMVEREKGYLLNVLGGGVEFPAPYMTGYACSKTAIMRLTEDLAREVQEYGVKVFAMYPGVVLTAMAKFILESPEGSKWRPAFKDIFQEGSDSSPQLLVNLALWLVSGKADRLSGRYFDARRDFEEIIRNTDAVLKEDLLTLRIQK